MKEYIERQALLNHLNERRNFLFAENGDYDHYSSGFDEAVDKVEDFPIAADVVERKRGEWLPCEPGKDVRFFCNRCDTEISTSWDYDQDEMWNFCPSCGADMREVDQ